MPTRPWSTPAPRGHCPRCGRDDVVLLRPTATKPWRRKAHAMVGDLSREGGAVRCRGELVLTPDEIPKEAQQCA